MLTQASGVAASAAQTHQAAHQQASDGRNREHISRRLARSAFNRAAPSALCPLGVICSRTRRAIGAAACGLGSDFELELRKDKRVFRATEIRKMHRRSRS